MKAQYYGLFPYRRILNLQEGDLERLAVGDLDVVLPFPKKHEPHISEHHGRYIKEADWKAVMRALEEVSPKYYEAYDKIFS